MIYNELIHHGTEDFPIALYQIGENHPRYEMAHHWHSQIEIIRVTEGKLDIKLNNNQYTAVAGDIIFINPETVHGAMPENCFYECIVCSLDFLCNTGSELDYFIDHIINGEYMIKEHIPSGKKEFDDLINKLFDTMKNTSSGQRFKVLGLLYMMFGAIMDNSLYTSEINSIHSNKSVVKLKNVLAYIRGNYDKPLSLEDMADAAGMSPKYFCHFFKTMTTKTPVEYLNSYRIEKASRSLLNSDASVTKIAFACGFNDLSYFIKTFKAIKGVSPSKFRKG